MSHLGRTVLPMEALTEAARRASRSHGVSTRAELLAAGLSRAELYGLVERGVLVRVATGAYRWASSAVTWEQRAMVATRSLGGDALLSHSSAVALNGLAGFRKGRLHVCVAKAGGRRPRSFVVHQVRALGPADRRVVDGIPVVAVPLALVQVAATASASRVEDALDDALCRGLARLDEVEAACRRGRDGSAALRRILGLWRTGELPHTVAEARLVRRLRAHGLPPPARQWPVHGADRRLVARVDLAYPAHRVAIEFDSFRWHEPRRARRHTLVRRNRLEALGWHVLVATGEDRADGGERLAGDVRALLPPEEDRSRGHLPVASPGEPIRGTCP